MLATAWRKSSFSDEGGGSCVEIALTETGAALRDSKNPTGGILRLPSLTWQRLLTAGGRLTT